MKYQYPLFVAVLQPLLAPIRSHIAAQLHHDNALQRSCTLPVRSEGKSPTVTNRSTAAGACVGPWRKSGGWRWCVGGNVARNFGRRIDGTDPRVDTGLRGLIVRPVLMGSGRIDFAHREAAFSGHSPETATGDLGGVSVGERALFFAHRYVSQNDGVLLQALVVYSIVAVGFLMLYLMMKNTARLNQVRKGVREVLKAEAGRVFSDTDAALLNRGMGLI